MSTEKSGWMQEIVRSYTFEPQLAKKGDKKYNKKAVFYAYGFFQNEGNWYR